MEALELAAAKRSATGKAVQSIRVQGLVPGIVYGHGMKPENIEVPAKTMEKAFAQAGGNKIVALKVGSGKALNVLIHDVQLGALRGELRHVDFYAVRMDEALKTEVPLRFVGESTAVYQEEGTLVKQTEEVEVSCLPSDLPDAIEVDISVLDDFEKTITLADLKLPKGVSLVEEDLTQLVAKVDAPRTDEEMAELEEGVAEELPEGVAEEPVAKDEN